MPNGLELCQEALKYRGWRYVWGGKSPSAGGLDCSGLTALTAKNCGLSLPHGAQNQRDFCRDAGKLIPIEQAKQTAGALLFRINEGPSNDHVAWSLGNRSTMEAHSKRSGCGVFADRAGWTHAALVPFCSYTYGAPPPPPPAATPGVDWAGLAAAITFCKAGAILRRGDSNTCVKFAQAGINSISGRGLQVDGQFGPSTEDAVRDLQRWFKLSVDGVVGPQTWRILYP